MSLSHNPHSIKERQQQQQQQGHFFSSPPHDGPSPASRQSSTVMSTSMTTTTSASSHASTPHHADNDDVSMGESNCVTGGMLLSSPPRTAFRNRRRPAGLGGMAAADAPSSSFFRSRLFVEGEEDDEGGEDHPFPPLPSLDRRRKPPVLKPLDLNLDFSTLSHGEGPTNAYSGNTAATTSATARPHGGAPFGALPKSKTPPLKTMAAGSARKRQADPHDLLYEERNSNLSNHHLDSSFDGSVETDKDGHNDPLHSSPVESPVDMYTSPQLSPSSTSSSRRGHNNHGHIPNKHVSNFYNQSLIYRQRLATPKAQAGATATAAQLNKSPCYRTLDGRTVQSKNPFSPMITSSIDTPNSTNYDLHHGNASMDTCSPATFHHQQPLVAEAISFPVSLPGGSGTSGSNNGTGGVLLRRKLSKRTGNNNTNGIIGMVAGPGIPSSVVGGMDGGNSKSASTGSGSFEMEGLVEPAATSWLYTRDGYPEKSGRYSFTGSPIKELSNDAGTTTSHAAPMAPPGTSNNHPSHHHHVDDEVCTSVHKIRRRTKGDDVVAAAAAHGEPLSWKRRGMQIDTDSDKSSLPPWGDLYGRGDDKNGGYQMLDTIRKEDISPTDVLSFPLLRASPSNTSTVPPTPMKPVRRPPVKKYTPIRKPLVPPTPMPRTRKARSFDEDEEFPDAENGGENATIGYLNLSPGGPSSRGGGGSAGHDHHRHPQFVATAPPPSRFHSDFDVIGELGNGSFGNVFKVLSRLDGCMYAIKVAHRPAKGHAEKDRMLKEVYALAALSDQADTATFHIVRYHQAWMEDQRLYIQTELCTTTLQAEMRQVAPAALPIQSRYKCLREILLALEYIHKNGMVHLDIKPENIFLKNDQFKLGDFGLVSKVSSHDVEEGDSRYMSVELLSGDHADLTKSDIFSLGISMYEVCLGGCKPLPSNGPEWQSLRAGGVAPLPETPDELHSIIHTMMDPAYRKRPSASELLTRPQLLSDEQKLLMEERNKVFQANLALVAQSNRLRALTPIPRKGALVRANTWNGSF